MKKLRTNLIFLAYYDINKDEIYLDNTLKGIKRLRWYVHEKIHQILYKIFGKNKGRFINLIWDILDNKLSAIKFYIENYNSTSDINLGGGGESEVTSHTYYYYKIKFPHTSIDPSQSVIFYDAFGQEIYTLPPYYSGMNYGEGTLSVPGNEQNTVVESVATATYYVFYSTADLVIDYANAEFKIAKNLIKYPAQTNVTATYEYISIYTPLKDVASVIDGKWDTQVQTEFFAQPPSSYSYAILDLGSVHTVQALDIVAGFYKPDEVRRFDIDFSFTLLSSLDGLSFYEIGDKTRNIKLTGGSSVSFEEDDLGVEFQARYIQVVLDNVKKIDYGTKKDATGTVIQEGIWVVAFTEIAAYDNIVIKAESTLIPTTYLSAPVAVVDTTIYVDSTEYFSEPGSAELGVAYIDNGDGTFDSFNYTGLTSTSFTGVTGLTETHSIDDMVVNEEESDTTIYDRDILLPKLKDRVYKANKVDNNTLYSVGQLEYVSKQFLKEFYKNHSKVTVNVVYSPHLQVGQTIRVIEPYNNTNQNYFIDSISDNNGMYNLVLARYPE
jgi:hypothetical protein